MRKDVKPDLSCERVIIRAFLAATPDQRQQLALRVDAKDFIDPQHRAAWEVMVGLQSSSEPVNLEFCIRSMKWDAVRRRVLLGE